MTLINPVHIAFVVAIALLVLGPKRLPEAARTLGNGMREFRETLNGVTRHSQTMPPAPESAAPAPAPSVDAIAPPPGDVSRQ
jgi:sec-independent protein translocase protein TatA